MVRCSNAWSVLAHAAQAVQEKEGAVQRWEGDVKRVEVAIHKYRCEREEWLINERQATAQATEVG